MSAGLAAAGIGALRGAAFAYHSTRMGALGKTPEDISPADEEASHQEFIREKQSELRQVEEKLARVQSYRPVPLFRSGRRLQHEITHLQDRARRLTHEISALG